MIERKIISLNNVPLLLCCGGRASSSSVKGTVFLFHGLGVSKEVNEKELMSLAEAGFLAVGVDNVGHGQRRFADFESRFAAGNCEFEANLIDAVRETAHEIPALIDGLASEYGINLDHIGVTGISMGGFISYEAVLADRRIKAAVPLIGSPAWSAAAEKGPDKSPEKFYPVAILSQTGGKDTVVPPAAARIFHEELAKYYVKSPERQSYIEFPDSEHFMRPDDWEKLWGNTIEWFARFL